MTRAISRVVTPTPDRCRIAREMGFTPVRSTRCRGPLHSAFASVRQGRIACWTTTSTTGFPTGSSSDRTRRPIPTSIRGRARHAHRRRRHRRGRCAVRGARAGWRGARPHVVLGVALPATAATAHRARDERPRARRQPARRRTSAARSQRRSAAAVRRRVVRRRGVLRVGRLSRAPDRSVHRRCSRRAPRRPARVHVLEPVLPDEGDPRLVGDVG